VTRLTVLDAEPPGVGIADLLEEVTELANAGELSSLAIAMVYRDGSGDQRWSHACSSAALIGSAAVLLHRLIRGELE
jgi:hypothetical protein